jgi:hypothetical protein
MQEPEAHNGPLSRLLHQSKCSVCLHPQGDLHEGLEAFPSAVRRSAAITLQRSLGNRFVQGLAVQAKSGQNRNIMPGQPKLDAESIFSVDLSFPQASYSLSKPAEIGALAFLQGQNITQLGRSLQHKNGVVQREVGHDGTRFAGNGDRAAWRAVLKKHVIRDYNQRTGRNLPINVDLSDLALDRCHKISFNDIEDEVVNYLNSAVADLTFIQYTDSLFTDDKQRSQMQKFRSFLMSAKKTGQINDIVRQANALLSILNSAIGNVMLGNARINRSIQEQLDLHFLRTNSGDYSLSPQSRRLAETWDGQSSGIPYTPHGQHIKSSSSGLVPVGSLTPRTEDIIMKQ